MLIGGQLSCVKTKPIPHGTYTRNFDQHDTMHLSHDTPGKIQPVLPDLSPLSLNLREQ